MVKIRLSRTGTKHKSSYRIVATDSRGKRNGKILEVIGFFNPRAVPPALKLKQERLDYWRNVGAQITVAVRKLIKNEKTP